VKSLSTRILRRFFEYEECELCDKLSFSVYIYISTIRAPTLTVVLCVCMCVYDLDFS
jgi:hypothetical protein